MPTVFRSPTSTVTTLPVHRPRQNITVYCGCRERTATTPKSTVAATRLTMTRRRQHFGPLWRDDDVLHGELYAMDDNDTYIERRLLPQIARCSDPNSPSTTDLESSSTTPRRVHNLSSIFDTTARRPRPTDKNEKQPLYNPERRLPPGSLLLYAK